MSSAELGAPKILKDILGQDLAGWKISPAYFMEIRHNSWGNFPVIIRGNDRTPVVVLQKRLLKKVWDALNDPAWAQITEMLVLVNPHTEQGFSLNSTKPEEVELIRIFSEKSLDMLCMQENPFEWSPGIVGGRNQNAKPPNFNS